MHSIAELGTNVPAFLGKLWKMVEDPITNDLIAWSSTGTSFVIKDEIRFARELLPMYYKHNNMASFIRQLNMYGFHKIVSPESGSMNLNSQDEIKFTHPYFLQGHPYLLENIKRKIGVTKVLPGKLEEKSPQVINKVLTDVRQMKGRQENMDSRLTAMKMENGALWRELSVLRQKHSKQQQIVNKLIQFLVTIVQQNHSGFTVKRKFPRMLQHHVKSPKNIIVNEDDLHEDTSDPSNSPMGPVIHELDPAEALLETVVEEANTEDPSGSDYFLNEPSEEDEVGEEMPQSIQVAHNDDQNMETIIGMPEDTLVIPENYFVSGKLSEEGELLRPKYINVVNRKPKQNETFHQQIKKPPQYVLKEPSNFKIPNSNHKLIIKPERNPASSQISSPNINVPPKINKPQNQQRTQRKQLQNNIQRLKRTPSQKPRNEQSKLLKTGQNSRGRTNEVQNIYRNNHQTSVKENYLEPNITSNQSPLSTGSYITVPYDSGVGGGVLATPTSGSTQLYLDNGNEGMTLPVIVEVPPDYTGSLQSTPDMLVTSPVIMGEDACVGISTPQSSPLPTVTVGPTTLARSPSPKPANSKMQVACVSDDKQVMSPSAITRSASSLNELDNHLDNVQSDLDNLKELLRSEGISLDANTLLGYFNDDPLLYNISDPVCSDQTKENLGNELMAYNPSLLDLTDLMSTEWTLPASPSEELPIDDTFAEVNTPQFVPQSPSFPAPDKKRKK